MSDFFLGCAVLFIIAVFAMTVMVVFAGLVG